jgi:hypothetical protein
MAYELDSEMLLRLQSLYGGMADGELLDLAAKPEDLTDAAREVLRGEMARRNLKAEAPEPLPTASRQWRTQEQAREPRPNEGIPTAILGSGPTLDSARPETSGVRAGESLLGRFHDAIEVGRACEFLEENEVPFHIEDVAQPRSGLRSFDSPPPVALNLIVDKAYRERAMAILRREMGLFPLQEVDEADAPVDDGTIGVLGSFGHRADAEDVAQILDKERIWHRIVADPEGTVEDENAFTLEVREVDLVRAGEVVEKAMGMPEE